MGYVEVRGLIKRFGSLPAVDEISLDVEPHEIVALLGPSGCGKTTTLRCIAGLETPTSGQISIAGQVVFSAKKNIPPESRDIGMVFQSYAIWPHMTVFKNVSYGLEMRGRPKSEIREKVIGILELVGLPGMEGRYPSQLSGGQQQRVALARSLVAEPKILLFDEPLSNLDAKLREHMRIELKDLIKRVGITSIYVTHDQVEAMAIADRIVLMDRGKIVQLGNARELYERPSSGFIAEFLGSINFLKARVVEPKGSETTTGLVKAVFDNGCEILFPAPSSLTAREVTLGLRPEHVQLYKEPKEGPNLWRAVVKKQVYMGSIIQVFAEIGQTTLRIQTSLEVSREGEGIFLGIDPQRVIYIPDTP